MRLQSDRVDLYAYTGGRPRQDGAPAVVFIHGAQHDHSVWILQSRYLAHHGFSVLALDLPGHGRSPGPPLASIEALGQWVLDALDAASVGSAHLIGHSMGSLIALEAAARRPAAIRTVSLLGTAAPMRVSQALLDAARDDEPHALDMINAWSHWTINGVPGCPGPGFSIYHQNRRLMERQPRGVLLRDFTACNAYESALAAAARLECPTLFISGRRDMMTPPKAAAALVTAVRERMQSIGGSAPEWVDIPDCGHAMMAERPDAVLKALRGFLSRFESVQSPD
jgi:pimeloyl-ACP methyl ester carboxylesterase